MRAGLATIRLQGLRAQVVLWTILPLGIFLIMFSLAGVGTYRSLTRALVGAENTRLVLTMANAISTELDHYKVGLQAFAVLDADDPDDRPVSSVRLTQLSQIWKDFSLLVVNTNGQVLAETEPESTWSVEARNSLPARPYESFMELTADRSAIFWGIPIEGPTDKRWLLGGVLISQLSFDQLFAIRHPDAQTFIALVDSNGYMLTGNGRQPASGKVRDWLDVSEAVAKTSGAGFIATTDDEDIIAYAPVANTTWVLVIREHWHALTASPIRFERAIPFILGIVAVVSFLTLYFGLRHVVRPLHLLSTQASRIGQGDFEAATQPVGGVHEIEDLRRTMDHMAHQLHRYQAALQDYLRAITQTQEAERARLGRELHDETIQTLIALGHKAQMVQRSLERDPLQTAERVTELRQMVADAIEEVRRFSSALRPLYLEELGLVTALEMLMREAGAAFQVIGTARRLEAEKELALYRIAQEALNNARRHAQATKLETRLHFHESRVILEVCDNGIGFQIPASLTDLTRTGHFGLMGMRERAQLVGGQLTMHSSPSAGAKIVVEVTG